MARDEKCNGCQFALHSVPMSQSSCWACKDHSMYTPEPTLPPSPDEDLFEEMYRKVHGDVEAHPENYDDMFAGYENDLNKAVALIEWQKQEIESLTIRMNAFGLAIKSLEEKKDKIFLFKENGEVVPLTKRAEWIAKKHMVRSLYARNYYCSACKYEPIEAKSYCPNCGAKMKGGAE